MTATEFNHLSLFERLVGLVVPAGVEFLAEKTLLGAGCYVAVASDGGLWFLKEVSNSPKEPPRPDVRVGGQLRVVERRNLRMRQVGRGTFSSSIVGYSLPGGSDSAQGLSYLLDAMGPTFDDSWRFEELLDFARRFADLFREREEVSVEIVKGLWGELKFLSCVSDPSELASGWHSDPFALLDFEVDAAAFEVKTTESESLNLHFRDQQLKTRRETGWVVSVSLYRSESGESIRDILARLSLSMNGADYQLVLQKTASVIGSALLQDGSLKFDLRPWGIQMIRMSDIPPLTNIPASMSRVSFVQDLSLLDSSLWVGVEQLPAILR